MKLLNEHHSFTGMRRDISISKHPTTNLYDAKNVRLTSRGDDTLFAITNEKGTSTTEITITGTYLGHCLINKYLVVFSTSTTKDYITRIDLSTLSKLVLYEGLLGFSTAHPIETIASYENENIQKVYWTDGENQPRVINIMDTSSYNSNSFDFVPKLTLGEHVRVTKLFGSGEFPPGVIQYAFTYFNKYGQESNIFHTTPLYYISHYDRGGNPEDKVANAFQISLSNLDKDNFEYLRIYSILRTSLNGTPIVKRVQDMKILEDRVISDDVETSSLWIYQFIGNRSNIEVSTDAGLTFSEDLSAYQVAPKDAVPLDSDGDGISSRDSAIWWEKDVVNGTNGNAYKFEKSKYPELVIKLDGYYYTWDEGTTTIYIGASDSYTGYKVFVGETSYKGASNIIKSNKIQVGEDIIVGVTFTDDGSKGDYIDPTELLYKGGETIKAKTMTQKDNTLFLGGITLSRQFPEVKDSLLEYSGVTSDSPIANDNITAVAASRKVNIISYNPTAFINTLGGPEDVDYEGASCFKSNEYYRLGIQFQHESGKWSEPYWIGDKQCNITPSAQESAGVITVPEFEFTLNNTSILSTLSTAGYKRARPVFVVPAVKDRTILCQGVGCPTVYRKAERFSDAKDSGNGVWTGTELGPLYAQSSWLFRVDISGGNDWYSTNGGGLVTPNNRLASHFEDNLNGDIVAPYLASTEVMGIYDDGHAFYVDPMFITLHSPDLVFDPALSSIDFTGFTVHTVGQATLSDTYGDISLSTSSPPIGSDAGGFVHRTIKTTGQAALITGLFFNDYVVDDADKTPTYNAYNTSSPAVDWPVFMWHKNGSINNDVNRDGRSANLLEKKISNYRYSGSTTFFNSSKNHTIGGIQLFDDDKVSLIKVNGRPYKGNIDMMVTPSTPSPYYIVGSPWRSAVDTNFLSRPYYRLALKDPSNTSSRSGVWTLKKIDGVWKWEWNNDAADDIGDFVKGLDQWREGVRIKYKSTPHLVVSLSESCYTGVAVNSMPLMEVRKEYNKDTIFGGTSDDALQASTWIPCGPSVPIGSDSITLQYKWGDSYFQRYECLKTYPFTTDDINQVVEIATFLVESRVNIDGRFDRNKLQTSALNMSPTNFNLLNPVYTQMDNFFSYRILDEDYYNINNFPNQLTWSKEKQSGAIIDAWTNITLAATCDLDGSKGSITSLFTWKDQIYCFQTKGVSTILFNSRVQIPVSDGVPIEIGNNYKVDGYKIISDGVGCDSEALVKVTSSGIYFIDSVSNHLYHIGNNIQDITTTHNMSSWFEGGNVISRVLYDAVHKDIYLVGEGEQALCFSEVLGQFTSFLDYGQSSLLESYDGRVFIMNNKTLYAMFEGDYNYFFTTHKPWEITFVSNGIDDHLQDFDKIFSTLDYRMDISSDGTHQPNATLDYIQVSNEYQDTGKIDLARVKPAATGGVHLYHKDINLRKKFRTWRIQIPRNQGSLDRIRNPWCKITLGSVGAAKQKAILQDINVQYYV